MAIINIETVQKIRDFYSASVREKSEAIRFYQESYMAFGGEFTTANYDAFTAVCDKMIASMRAEEKKLSTVDAYIAIRNQSSIPCSILRAASADRAEKVNKDFLEVLGDCQERCPEIF